MNNKVMEDVPMGPVSTPEKNVEEDDDVKFILRVKKILDKTGVESQSETVVCELLWKIESMELTVETLEATMIGRTVNALKKHHASEEVCKIAATLVKQWKSTALEEWSKKQSNIVEPATSLSQQVKPTEVINMMMNMEIRNKGESSSEKASKSGSGEVNMIMDSSDKLEATKSLQLKSTNVKNMNIEKKLEGSDQKVRKMAVMMMMDAMEKLEATKSLQLKSTNMKNNMKTEKKVERKYERASKNRNNGVDVMMDSFKKSGATKRKLPQQQQGFEFDQLQELENLMKKQRIEDERERSRIIHRHNTRMFVLLPPGLDPASLLVN